MEIQPENPNTNKSVKADSDSTINKFDEFEGWRYVTSDPNRRITWDKWTTKMAAIRKKLYNNEDNIIRINVNAIELGSGDLELDNLINFANDLYSYLPDHIFKHQILIEIEENLLEFKTKRQRDHYLTRIESELGACAQLFRSLTGTHPEYKSKYAESYMPDHDLDWRQMMRDGRSYTLKKYYMGLLVIAEVLEGIKSFVTEHLHPEEGIKLDNELSAVNHRLVLLYQLGIFKTLYHENYNLIGKNGFVKLLANIIDVPKDPNKDPKKHLEGFRIEVTKLIDEMNNPIVKKSVLNQTAISKVNAFLAEVGLLA